MKRLAQPALQGLVLGVAIVVEVSAQKFIGIYRNRSHLLILSVTSVLLFDTPLLIVDIILDPIMLYFFVHQQEGFVGSKQFSKEFKFSVIVPFIDDVFKMRVQLLVLLFFVPNGLFAFFFIGISNTWIKIELGLITEQLEELNFVLDVVEL